MFYFVIFIVIWKLDRDINFLINKIKNYPMIKKLKAIWNIIWCDRYAIFTCTDPKYESEYMQTSKYYQDISDDTDKYFISIIQDNLKYYN